MNPKSKSILILGATSSIAREIAYLFAAEGSSIHLVSRSEDRLERVSQDISVRFGVPVSWSSFDAGKDCAEDIFVEAERWLGSVDGVIACQGTMPVAPPPDQTAAETERLLAVNFVSIAVVLQAAARAFEKKGGGFIAAITSVAGDRGRRSNYVYGSGKAGLNTLLQGLRSRLSTVPVPVLTVKAGFMDTPMTYGKRGVFFAASPSRVALGIVRAIEKGKSVLYVPRFWKWIMLVIRLMPEFIFKRITI